MSNLIDPPFRWDDGPTNRIDALLDLGLPNKVIARRLFIPVRMIRRRRGERFPAHPPIIPPQRQLEICLAALDKNQEQNP